MSEWIAAHPGDAQAARGLIWMAQLRLADHRDDLARPLFLQVRRAYPRTEWSLHALKGLADLELGSRHYGTAIAMYQSLAKSDSPFFQYVGAMDAARAQKERLRFLTTLSLLGGMLVLWAWRLKQLASLQALWPPPREVVYPLPVLALIAIAALGPPGGEGLGGLLLALGALLLLWLNGAYLRARPPAGAWRILHGLLGLMQAGVLLYVSVVLSGLWDKFHDTLTLGAG